MGQFYCGQKVIFVGKIGTVAAIAKTRVFIEFYNNMGQIVHPVDLTPLKQILSMKYGN